MPQARWQCLKIRGTGQQAQACARVTSHRARKRPVMGFYCVRGLEHATAGNFPDLGKSCNQNMGPLAGGVNPLYGKTVMDVRTRDIRASAEARGLNGRP